MAFGPSTLVYRSETEDPWRRMVAQVHAASAPPAPEVRERACPDASVEIHTLGEFPMTCLECHIHVNADEAEMYED